MFQFQSGTIKSLEGWTKEVVETKFQFQSGTIKRPNRPTP